MTVAVRGILAFFYWPAVTLFAMLQAPWLVPLTPASWWLKSLTLLGAGGAMGVVAAVLERRVLDRLAARIAEPFEVFAAEWREISRR